MAESLLDRRASTGRGPLQWRSAPRTLDLQRAAYDAAAANYRQVALTAFQQVEDDLAALRVPEQEAKAKDQAVRDAEQSLEISTEQYKGGIANYLQVTTAQATFLPNQRAAIDVQTRRMTSSVLLIEALGGGWTCPSALIDSR